MNYSETPKIIGSGGGGKGGGSGSQPVEESDTLRSFSRAKILYAICGGEIAGFPTDAFKRIYLDNLPLQNQDGSLNFKDVFVDIRNGANFQDPIPNFDSIAQEYQVGVKLTKANGSVTRILSDENADYVVIRLSVPSLQSIDDKGNIRGFQVQFSCSISVDGGPDYTVFTDTIAGKTTGPYEQSYRIPLYKPGKDYRITMVRITEDSASNKVQSELIWQSYTSVIAANLAYPNTALLALSINAEQFSSTPDVGVRPDGWICSVPTNYNPVTRTYTGIWDGTFKRAYSNNPAWIFYTLLIDNIYGCGRVLNVNAIDKPALYNVGQYCDQLVPDGFGGIEPRFVCNAHIESADDAYNVLNAIAAVFRGMLYWSNGLITAVQDSPTNYTKIYGEENTVQEVDDTGLLTIPNFNYAGSGSKARHTVCLVSYTDKNDFHKVKTEPVIDEDGLRRYGYRETSITAFGCDSRGQAARIGKWLLYTEQNETEILTFRVGSDGMLSRPGEVIRVIDPTRSGRRQTGRIAAVYDNRITLDVTQAELDVDPATATLSFLDPISGIQNTIDIIELVESPTGALIATLSQTPTNTPIVGTPWMIQTPDLQGESWRVIGVTEDEPNIYTITATSYNISKYGAIERGLALDEIPVSIVGSYTTRPQAPTNLTITESLFESRAAGLRIRIDIGWNASPSSGVDRYKVDYSPNDGSNTWITLGETRETFITVDNFNEGDYLFRVQAVNRLGLRSDYTENIGEIKGLKTPPLQVTNFIAVPVDRQVTLRWDAHPDLDVRVGGRFIIKYTPKLADATWLEGFEIAFAAGSSTFATVLKQSGTYMIKAVDSVGNESLLPTFTTVNQPPFSEINIIQTLIESPKFTGTQTNLIVENQTLQLAPDNLWDGLQGNIDDLPGNIDNLSPGLIDEITGNWDDIPGFVDGETLQNNVLSGTYNFAQSIDLGAVFVSTLTASISAVTTNSAAYFDSIPELFDDIPGVIDASEPQNTSVFLEIRKSQDGVNYDEWQIFLPGDYAARSFEFRLRIESQSPTANVFISGLEVTVDMPDRTLTGTNTSFDVVEFLPGFRAPPIVSPTISAPSPGDTIEIVTVTKDYFVAIIKNNGFVDGSKNYTWIARGYGRSIN